MKIKYRGVEKISMRNIQLGEAFMWQEVPFLKIQQSADVNKSMRILQDADEIMDKLPNCVNIQTGIATRLDPATTFVSRMSASINLELVFSEDFIPPEEL